MCCRFLSKESRDGIPNLLIIIQSMEMRWQASPWQMFQPIVFIPRMSMLRKITVFICWRTMWLGMLTLQRLETGRLMCWDPLDRAFYKLTAMSIAFLCRLRLLKEQIRLLIIIIQSMETLMQIQG